MNKSYLGLLAAALIGAAPAAYADDVLTGDVRLACEAILCLPPVIAQASVTLRLSVIFD